MSKYGFNIGTKIWGMLCIAFLQIACSGEGGSSDPSPTPTQASVPTGRAFITTWKTDNPGETADNQIMIATFGEGYNYSVDWGDGSTDANVTGDITHTYDVPGTYTVTINGAFPRIIFGLDGFDNDKLLSIEQWGDIAWESMQIAFLNCSNLVLNATDAPDLSQVTTMRRMFSGASSINSDINDWDVSNVTDMNELFASASSFNQPLNGWDVSSVTTMSAMFQGALSFNQSLSDWDVAAVTDMSAMFAAAESFNQNINDWDVGEVTDMSFMFSAATSFEQVLSAWNVGSVTNMTGMFSGAILFNGLLDIWQVGGVTNMASMFSGAEMFNGNITSWNVSDVTDMSNMFNGAASFDQNLSSWDIREVADMTDMFTGIALSTANYDALLNGWNALGDVQQSVTFGAGNSTFSAASTDARENLSDFRDWTITDGGLAQ